jgi:hypothetical protein
VNQASARRRRIAFGMPIELGPGLELPALRPGREAAPGRPATHVRVAADELRRRWEPVGSRATRTRELRAGDQLLLSVDVADEAGYLLRAPGRASVLVAADGRELICAPEPEATDWAVLLTAQALPLAATLRGLEVFHAAGLELGGEAVLLAGDPGAGKSSLAAALVLCGAALLSDDAVALERDDGSLLAHAGSGVLQLRATELERLTPAERAVLDPLEGPVAGRARFVPSPSTGSSASPLGALFLLERSATQPAIERVARVDPFALLGATFNLSVRTPERLARHLDLCAELAATVPIWRLRVQPGVNAGQLADLLVSHLVQPCPN